VKSLDRCVKGMFQLVVSTTHFERQFVDVVRETLVPMSPTGGRHKKARRVKTVNANRRMS